MPSPSAAWLKVLQRLDAAEAMMTAVRKVIELEMDKAFAAAALIDMWLAVEQYIAEANKLTHELYERGDPGDLVNIAKSTKAIDTTVRYRMNSERIVGLIKGDNDATQSS